MLRVQGSRKQACDGFSRRDFLTAGGLTAAGFSLSEADAAPAAVGRNGFGKAKRAILLYLYGAASQAETFDPKPDAPVDIRGPFRPRETSVSGIRISEHLPLIAKQMHRITVIRSLTHPFPIHGAAYALTGNPICDIPMELNPRDQRHWPYIGSVVDYLRGSAVPGVPANVCLPWRISSRSAPHKRAGVYGGFLGTAFDPIYTEFIGDSPKGDPYRAVRPDGYFQFTPSAAPQPDITLDRLNRRRGLLGQLDDERHRLDGSDLVSGYNRSRQRALSLLTSESTREALDLTREPLAMRESYGMTLFGQGTLAARRLLERGVRFATVVWDEFDRSCISGWDTHVRQEQRLTGELLPGLDRALSALIEDLNQRGMLDETLIMVLTEHGRTPKVNPVDGGGRDHWSDVYSGLIAGGGAGAGRVVGASDAHAAYVHDAPVSPKDILATAYHLLGIPPTTEILDRQSRPLPLVPEGRVLESLLA